MRITRFKKGEYSKRKRLQPQELGVPLRNFVLELQRSSTNRGDSVLLGDKLDGSLRVSSISEVFRRTTQDDFFQPHDISELGVEELSMRPSLQQIGNTAVGRFSSIEWDKSGEFVFEGNTYGCPLAFDCYCELHEACVEPLQWPFIEETTTEFRCEVAMRTRSCEDITWEPDIDPRIKDVKIQVTEKINTRISRPREGDAFNLIIETQHIYDGSRLVRTNSGFIAKAIWKPNDYKWPRAKSEVLLEDSLEFS